MTGTRLGAYEILALIGAGGMGEVYRARDTRLNRDVALKVLPELFAADPDRLARFKREAQLLASLNHPNIAAIHGFEEAGGVQALVLELVEGPTLADRIAHGPIPLDEALPIARQIAEALEAAHEQGVIHRDLKPANIKVRPDGTVKVLDFGLAKAFEPEVASGGFRSDTMSPTITSPVGTRMGIILGTAAYMSPEQARGRPVDKRTDIWAFGCVLYEMLTGRRAFVGDDVTDVLARVLEREPDWTALPRWTPLAIDRLLRRCLDKDRKQRIPDIGVARLEIDDARSSSGRAATAETPQAILPRERLLWATAIVVAVATTASVFAFLTPARSDAPETRLQVVTPPGNPAHFALSPDGRSLVFQAVTEGTSRLWVRPLGSDDARPLAGTDGAGAPFWSPDGRSIGFFAGETLKRLDLAGGTVRTLADARYSQGGSWNANGMILFVAANSSPVSMVSADGGDPVFVTRLDTPRQAAHRYPQFLPDGRHFIYWVSGDPDMNGIWLGDLESNDARRLLEADMTGVFAPPDHLLYVRQGRLLSQRLDLDTLRTIGAPVTIAERLERDTTLPMHAALSASTTGSLAYRTTATVQRRFTWIDRSGTETGTIGEFETDSDVGLRLSRDGRVIAFTRSIDGQRDLWTMDIVRGTLGRLTSDSRLEGWPAWSPDGAWVAFDANPRGIRDIFMLSTNGPRADELVLASAENKNLMDWSADGRFFLYTSLNPDTSWDLWAVSVEGDRKPFAIAQSRHVETLARFSPDGRWIGYTSDETGRDEVYLRPFPEPGVIRRVSTAGGYGAWWRADGREIFYIAPGGRLMAVRVSGTAAGRSDIGEPVALLTLREGVDIFEPSNDGQRFLLSRLVGKEPTPTITVLLNWADARR